MLLDANGVCRLGHNMRVRDDRRTLTGQSLPRMHFLLSLRRRVGETQTVLGDSSCLH